MSNLIKQHFRATNGLDAGGNKVINVALADRTVMTDGASVEYIIQENTIQKYDSTRGYLEGFAVTFERRVWIANKNITKPAGTFNPAHWTSIRVDPNWIYLVRKGEVDIHSGEYINVDTSGAGNVSLMLPIVAEEGDTIVIRDIGGKPGYNGVLIKTPDTGRSINYNGTVIRELRLTHPYGQIVLTFNNGAWRADLTDLGDTAKVITPGPAGDPWKLQSSDNVIRRYSSNAEVFVVLPEYANNGDIIYFTDLDNATAVNHMTIKTFDNTTSIGKIGQQSVQIRTAGPGLIVYDSANNIWRIHENDTRTRLRIIRDDVILLPNESVTVFGTNNTIQKTITITLPIDAAVGDFVTIAMNYMRKGQKTVIKAAKGSTIASSLSLLQFPKRSVYPPATDWVQSDSIEFDGNKDYVPVIKLAYIEESGKKYWAVAQNVPTVERVDGSNPDRLGVIALATQAQANVQGSPTSNELAITPRTLDGRRSTETLNGITRIATSGEVNKASTSTEYLDSIIVSPKKLNGRIANETMRGLVEIATQAEVNAGTLHEGYNVTPKTLNNRTASTTLTGIIKILATGGTPVAESVAIADGRKTAGTGIYDFADYNNAVTPKTLREMKATERSAGIVWIATDAEVRNGTPTGKNPYIPIVITPESLQKKTANETQIGFVRIATQSEVNAGTLHIPYVVTPKTLNDRTANYNRTGIAQFAKDADFEAGTSDDLMVNPKKIYNKFSNTDRIQVTTSTGLTIEGNLWDHYTIGIKKATTTQNGTTTLATQTEVDAGTEATKIVTPATLAKKIATESADGLVRFANKAEVVAGSISNKAIAPANLKNAIQVDTSWQATNTVRGTVKLSKGASTWTGSDVTGADNTAKAEVGVAVSPYELRNALSHYLPILGKAADSSKFDGLVTDNFARRDINQTITGAYTFNQSTTFNKEINVNGVITAKAGEVKISPVKDADLAHIRLLNSNGTERSVIYAETQTTTTGTVKIRVLRGSRGTISNAAVYTFSGDGQLNVPNQIIAPKIKATSELASNGTVVVSDMQALKVEGTNLIVGAQSHSIFLRSKDAVTQAFVQDSSGSHLILNTKNYASNLDSRYTRRTGDTMSGKLVGNQGARLVGDNSWVSLDAPTDGAGQNDSRGVWSIEVTQPTTYNKLPGFMIPVHSKDPIDPEVEIVTDYKEINAPGTLSQFGNGKLNTFQIWAPRPLSGTEGASSDSAETFWIRQMNPVSGKWGGWGRMYTSSLPPLPRDIGATSSTGTKIKNLEVVEWIKLGPVKIWPDRTTQTLKFEWIGD